MIKENERVLMTIEVTERPVDSSRVIATFTDKISPFNLTDYVFIVNLEQIEAKTKQQTEKYFAQGYDVNFVDIKKWLVNTLVTVGVKGRKIFQDRVIHYLSDEQIPKAFKVAWNEELEKLTRIS